jgi:hypothetical protein
MARLRAKFPQLRETGRFLAAGKDPHPKYQHASPDHFLRRFSDPAFSLKHARNDCSVTP